MRHSYRILEQWNQWLSKQFLGRSLLEAEQQALQPLLIKHFGKHALLIGVPGQHGLLKSTVIPCQTLLTPLINLDKKVHYIEGNFHELPIHSGSIDAVFLPHTLELVDNPRQLLAEACRITKPEGLIIICGFNPISLWGVKKILNKQKMIPWSISFMSAYKIRKWLHLADFSLEKQKPIVFRPPILNQTIYDKLIVWEYIGSKCFPMFGSVYILLARAKVIPLTRIRLKWKQPLSGIRISTSMSGPV